MIGCYKVGMESPIQAPISFTLQRRLMDNLSLSQRVFHTESPIQSNQQTIR
jgi:hypothetical protein